MFRKLMITALTCAAMCVTNTAFAQGTAAEAKAMLEKAPAYRMEDLTKDDGKGAIRDETFAYFHAPQYW